MAVTKKTAFIDDGYTLEHCFLPDKFREEEVEIQFRPATSLERVKMNTLVLKLAKSERMEEIEKETCRFISSHLVSLKVDGNEMEISEAKIAKAEPHLVAEMYGVIFGEAPAVAKERSTDQKN